MNQSAIDKNGEVTIEEAEALGLKRRHNLWESSAAVFGDKAFSHLKKDPARYYMGCVSARNALAEAMAYEARKNSAFGMPMSGLMTESTVNPESTTISTDTQRYIRTILPLLRRVPTMLIAPDLVAVQPIGGPQAAVFYLEAKFADNKGQVKAGDNVLETLGENYSSGRVDRQALAEGDGSTTNFSGYTGASDRPWVPIYPGTVIVQATVNGTELVLTDNGAGALSGDDGTTGTINYQTGQWEIDFTDPPDDDTEIKFTFDYNIELGPSGRLTFHVTYSPVEAQEYRLNTSATFSSYEDMMAQNGVQLDREMIAFTSQQLALETDRNILNDLRAAGAGARGNAKIKWDGSIPTYMSPQQHYSTLAIAVNRVGAGIATNTRRAAANFAVASTEVSTLLRTSLFRMENRPAFADANGDSIASPIPGQTPSRHGQYPIYSTGILAGSRIVWYEDTWASNSTILVGLRGEGYLDSGYVYLPYIPATMLPNLSDPRDAVNHGGMRARYARRLIRSSFYGQVVVTNL